VLAVICRLAIPSLLNHIDESIVKVLFGSKLIYPLLYFLPD
jgi:hypothetical protein